MAGRVTGNFAEICLKTRVDRNNLPGRELLRESQRGVRRTGRGQPGQLQAAKVQDGAKVPVKEPCGSAAIEEHAPDRAMRGEKSGKIVDHQRFFIDGGIEAPRAVAEIQHIPDGDASAAQGLDPGHVILGDVEAQQTSHMIGQKALRGWA